MKLKGKFALVTGASRGIGAATAICLASEGAIVALVARSQRDLEEVAGQIRAQGGQAHVFPCDLSDVAAIRAMAEQVLKVGVPDVVVNNAGQGRWLFVEETPEGEEDMMTALPYLAAFRVTRAFLPQMLARKSGTILNVNSPVALMTWSGATGYASSRWALRGFTEALRSDLAGTGIRVSQVMLGETDSNYFDANPGSRERLPRISKILPVLQSEDAGRHVVKAIRGDRKEYTAPFMLWMMRLMMAVFPRMTRAVLRSTDMPHPAAKR